MDTQSVTTTHIELRPNRAGALRAYVVGTRVRVQDIVSDHERHGLSPEQIAREHPHLSLAQIHAALAYYFDHRDEVVEHMKSDDDYAKALVDSHRDETLGSRDADANSLPS